MHLIGAKAMQLAKKILGYHDPPEGEDQERQRKVGNAVQKQRSSQRAARLAMLEAQATVALGDQRLETDKGGA
jgi:hypothetical protein